MSTVTDVIVTAGIMEEPGNIEALDAWLVAEGHPKMLRVDEMLGGLRKGYAMQLRVWINACNYLDEDEFCRVLWEKCGWEAPVNVQCFFQQEEIDGVRERRNETVDQAMRDFIGEWVELLWRAHQRQGWEPLGVEAKTGSMLEQAKALGFSVPQWRVV